MGLVLVLLGSLFFLIRGIHDEPIVFGSGDFVPVYSGARCLLEGCNPYNQQSLMQVDRGAGSKAQHEFFVTVLEGEALVYPPPTLLLAVPLGAMRWKAAHWIWLALIGLSFVVASLLMWELCADELPLVAGALLGVFTATSTLLLMTGNPTGLAISLCAIAVWCFLRGRWPWLGVVFMGLSLVLKPQETGFIWLYFVLASADYRRLALKALAVVGVVSAPAILWISLAPASRHWVADLHAMVAATLQHGSSNDPGIGNDTSYQFLNLQAIFSVIRDDPRFYGSISYGISGLLLGLWGVASVRYGVSRRTVYIALATGAALTMLPVYHRTYDLRLLLLMFPAVSLLWAQRDRHRWLAIGSLVVVTGACVNHVTSFVQHLQVHTRHGPRWMQMMGRPYCLLALALALVWLWVQLAPARAETGNSEPSEAKL